MSIGIHYCNLHTSRDHVFFVYLVAQWPAVSGTEEELNKYLLNWIPWKHMVSNFLFCEVKKIRTKPPEPLPYTFTVLYF